MSNRVLVLDSDTASQALLKAALSPLHLETVTRSTAMEALQWLQTTNELPRLILLNLRLPAHDGLTSSEFIRHVSQTAPYADVPLLVLISGGREDAQHAMDLGAATCIGLPFRPGDLQERVQAVLQHYA